MPSMMFGAGRRGRFARRHTWRAGVHDARDAIVFDDDVRGTEGRRAGAVDHHHVADGERRKRTGAFAGPAIGRGNQSALPRVGDEAATQDA